MIYKFGKFKLCSNRRILMQNGRELDVEPQVFDLIAYLITHPGRVISRDELLEKIWNGRIVSESSISTRINQARKVLGDDGRKQALIKTVHNKGFRFVGDLEVVDVSPNLPSATPLKDSDRSPPAETLNVPLVEPSQRSNFIKGAGLFALGVAATLGLQAAGKLLSGTSSPHIDIMQYKEGEEIIGVPGRNTLDLSNFREYGFNVGLPPGVVNSRNAPDARSLYTLKNIQHIIGSPQDDRLRGSYETNIFRGGEGNDVLEGYGGVDQLYGEAGDDILNGGYFVDEIFGGAGNDVIFVATDSPGDNIDGGEGNDTLNLSRFTYSGYLVDLDSGFSRELDDRGMGDFKLINVENIIGSPQDDIFHGDDTRNTIDGGAGRDTVILKSPQSAYELTKLTDGAIQIVSANDQKNIDVLRNIESLKFSDRSMEVDVVK